MPARTLLAGCGRLGTLLGERLVAAGGEVIALRRDPSGLPAAFGAVAADLREPLGRPLPAVDALVITLPPGTPPAPGQEDDYALALRHLAAALPRPPRRTVFVSSTRVFEGRTDGRPITEDDEPVPLTERGRTLRRGELLAVELLGALVLRPAGIYGPGRDMLLRRVREGAAVQYGRRTNRIHETDLVRTLEALLLAADPPRVLHAVDRAPASLGEVVTHIAREWGLEPPPRATPETVAGTVLDGSRLLGFLGGLEYPTFREGYRP
ncbi:SDR family NAD(P)-dependent oxidoreductase [Citricoccus sp. SGAir0253]|nr:SDR family NAD(P)-dependent oxidoreductase [Citricoccus sp. SGAir0253]